MHQNHDGEHVRYLMSLQRFDWSKSPQWQILSRNDMILILSFLAFLSNFSYGLTSFGSAIIFQCGWHLAELIGFAEGGINAATAHIATMMFVTRIVQAVYLRSHCNPRIAIVVFCSSVPFLVLGTFMAYSVSSSTMRVVVGVLFLIVLVLNVSRKGIHLPPPLQLGNEASMLFGGEPSHLIGLIFASSCSGWLMGICATPGPPLMVFLTSCASVDPTTWRATSAFVQLLIGTIQLLLLLFVFGKDKNVDVFADSLMIVSGLVGLWLGNTLSQKVDADMFSKVVIVFLAMSSASMITSRARASYQLYATISAALFTVGVILVLSARSSARAEAARQRADHVIFEALKTIDDDMVGDDNDAVELNNAPVNSGAEIETEFLL